MINVHICYHIELWTDTLPRVNCIKIQENLYEIIRVCILICLQGFFTNLNKHSSLLFWQLI